VRKTAAGNDGTLLMTALAGLWKLDGKPDAGDSCRRMLAARSARATALRRACFGHSLILSGTWP
jgi:hypothetical protein